MLPKKLINIFFEDTFLQRSIKPGSHPPVMLTYFHIYFYENKYNLIWWESFKKIFHFFGRLFTCSHKNNIKMFWYYSHDILIRLLRSKKDRWRICYFWRQPIEYVWKKSSVIFVVDTIGKKCDCTLSWKTWFLPVSNLNLKMQLSVLTCS